MAQTCEQSANSVVEDADLHHLMLSGGITKILPVKKRPQESLWSRKQPHETCKNNQSLFISDWTLYWAELTDAGLHSWNCGLNCTQQTGYLMTGALLTMSTVQTEAQAWCRLALIVVGFPPPQKQKKYVKLEGTGTPGVELGRAAQSSGAVVCWRVSWRSFSWKTCNISETPSSGIASPIVGKQWQPPAPLR